MIIPELGDLFRVPTDLFYADDVFILLEKSEVDERCYLFSVLSNDFDELMIDYSIDDIEIIWSYSNAVI